MSYTIGVIGTGYVGLVTGTCLAEVGNTVVCVDVDPAKVEMLSAGIPTIYERGLDQVLERNVREQRIRFTLDLHEAVTTCSIIMLCLQTEHDDGTCCNGFMQIQRETDTLLSHIPFENLVQSSFVDRWYPSRKHLYLRWVDVDTHNRVSNLCEARTRHETDISGSDDANGIRHRLFRNAMRDNYDKPEDNTTATKIRTITTATNSASFTIRFTKATTRSTNAIQITTCARRGRL